MRYSAAQWRGPVPNCNTEAPQAHMGLVLHIMEGPATAADAWFHNPASQASANFGCLKDGTVWQWVDSDEIAWAQGWEGNRNFLSIENEGAVEDADGGALTPAMIESIAHLYAWGHKSYDWPLQLTDSPATPGLGWHGMGAGSGNPRWADPSSPYYWGHPACPGEAIKRQRSAILARVRELVGWTQPTPSSVKDSDVLLFCRSTEKTDPRCWLVVNWQTKLFVYDPGNYKELVTNGVDPKIHVVSPRLLSNLADVTPYTPWAHNVTGPDLDAAVAKVTAHIDLKKG